MKTVNIHLPHGGGINIPKMIVIHAMAEYIHIDASASKYFKTKKNLAINAGDYHAVRWLDILGLSAHALIPPTGVSIRCRNDDEIAWHARGHNKNTLGIEFLVPGVFDYYSFLKRIKTPYLTHQQILCGKEQIIEWVDKWNINSIKSHSEIDPKRKHDPGAGFDMNEFTEVE